MTRKYIDIEVTQDDIDKGIRYDSNRCPLARATKRKFPFTWVSAGAFTLTIQEEVYTYSNILTEAVTAFDNKHQMKPRTYRVFREY